MRLNGYMEGLTKALEVHQRTSSVQIEDIIFQAQSFLSWHRRADGDLEANFKWWACSKDFCVEDEKAIWLLVEKALALVETDEPALV